MNTDWNSPQGNFETTEKQADLLTALSGQHVTVHTCEEADFDYMEEEDVAFVVKNPHSEEDLLVELGGGFSLFFGLWHGQYKATEESLVCKCSSTRFSGAVSSRFLRSTISTS